MLPPRRAALEGFFGFFLSARGSQSVSGFKGVLAVSIPHARVERGDAIDPQLLARYVAGERDAFVAVLAQCRGALYAVISRYFAAPSTRRTRCKEVLLQLYRVRAQFDVNRPGGLRRLGPPNCTQPLRRPATQARPPRRTTRGRHGPRRDGAGPSGPYTSAQGPARRLRRRTGQRTAAVLSPLFRRRALARADRKAARDQRPPLEVPKKKLLGRLKLVTGEGPCTSSN